MTSCWLRTGPIPVHASPILEPDQRPRQHRGPARMVVRLDIEDIAENVGSGLDAAGGLGAVDADAPRMQAPQVGRGLDRGVPHVRAERVGARVRLGQAEVADLDHPPDRKPVGNGLVVVNVLAMPDTSAQSQLPRARRRA